MFFTCLNKRTQLTFLAVLALAGCAQVDEGLKTTADSLAPQDFVTGKRVLNPESEAAEIQRAEKQQKDIIASAQAAGYTVDTDTVLLSHLREMLYELAYVSHRPKLSWEVHLIESPEVNAFAIGGGKIFFYRGLFNGLVDQSDDNEIAAVMAHEMGHIAARHIGKNKGLVMAEELSNKARKATAGKLYQASFTTLQEDEADRIGLLYMTLAGYDPRAAARIWIRADKQYGSDPHAFNYAYDHSLNADRANKIARLMPVALKYFEGQDTINNDYEQVLANNELLPRTNASENGSGTLAALNAVINTATQHLEAKNEELSRQIKMQEDQAEAQRLTRLDLKLANTSNGYRALVGHIQNISNRPIAGATVTVYYVNAAGQPVYAENVPIQNASLLPGRQLDWSTYVKNVPGTAHIQAKVTGVQWAN